MSSLKLQGATSGEITVTVPSVSGTNTLTLPASTGTVLTDTAPKAGNILQVVSTTSTTVTSTTSTSYVDVSGLSLTITPTSSTSKILVIGSVNYSSSVTTDNAFFRLMRDTTSIGNGTSDVCFGGRMGTTAGVQTGSINHLDSPATTSATTYKFQFKAGASATARVNERGATGSDYSSHITLMEIAG
jgi:hypothetical protein